MKRRIYYFLIPDFLLISLSLQSLIIKAKWSENIWANRITGPINKNTTAYTTLMCADGSFYAAFSFFD